MATTTSRYQLKDKEAGFYDDETGLDISRDQVVELDLKKGVGTKTMQMIASGGLIEVKTGTQKKEEESSEAGGKTASRTTSTPKGK